MLEHLDKNETRVFFNETYRFLKLNGIMRAVVLNFQKLVNEYNLDKNVFEFIKNSYLLVKKPKTLN